MKILGVQLDLANKKIVNLTDGTAATDAVTVQQMQAFVRGLSWKASARAASTANVTLATPGATMDGVTLVSGDRVLLKNQTAGSENGIYIWTGAAALLTRATDADIASELVGATLLVTEGTVNADKAFVNNTDAITLGTTTLSFVQFGGGTVYSAGSGLTLSGSVFSVVAGTGIIADGTSTRIDPSVVARKSSASIGNGAASALVMAHGLGSADLVVTVRDTATGEKVYPDLVIDATNITTTFATAPASNAYRVTAVG